MGGALNTLANFQAAAINGSCGPWITFAEEKVCQVALSGEGGRIFRSNLSLERVDELMVERLGRKIVPLVGEQIGKVVQTLKAVRPFRARCAAHGLPGAACIRFCLGEASPRLQDQGEVVETCQSVRMIRSQSSLPGFQHLLMESLSLEILAAIVEQIRQIVHRGQSVDMVGTERSLTLA